MHPRVYAMVKTVIRATINVINTMNISLYKIFEGLTFTFRSVSVEKPFHLRQQSALHQKIQE